MPELELDEEGTRISLTIVDTPGFGDQIDNEARYIIGQLRRYTMNVNKFSAFLRSLVILNANTTTF